MVKVATRTFWLILQIDTIPVDASKYKLACHKKLPHGQSLKVPRGKYLEF